MRLFLEPHNCFILTCILIKPSFRISTGVPSPLINKGGVKSSELIYFVHIQLDWKWCDESCIHKKLPFIFLSVFSQQPCMHHAWMYNNNNNNCAYCLVGLWFDRLNYKDLIDNTLHCCITRGSMCERWMHLKRYIIKSNRPAAAFIYIYINLLTLKI